MHELVYTSVPKGLKPGSQGFCTVACSASMPPNLMMRLEALTAYRPIASGQDQSSINPVVLSYLVLRVGGTDWHVLSRIADAGVDYTQRSNKITHHIVLETSELPPAGPAALLQCEGRFFRRWDDEPKVITKPTPFPMVDLYPQICMQWEHETGDAGWGGVLAETVGDQQPVIMVVKPETNVIALFAESLALLPPELRWQTTLTTYYTRFPSGVNCRWRCIMAGSPELSQIGLSPEAIVVDLTQPLNLPVPNPLVKAARSGKLPAAIEAEKQATLPLDQASETSSDVVANDEMLVAVPVGKTRKKKGKSKRKMHDELSNTREQRSEKSRQEGKRRLLVLLVLGLVFFVFSALLLAALISARGCNDSVTRNSTPKSSH